MTITIKERKLFAAPGVEGLGFESSDLIVDGAHIGVVVWPINDLDYGMLDRDANGRLHPPVIGRGGPPRPWIRFGRAKAKPVDGGIPDILAAIKDELNLDTNAKEVAWELARLPEDYAAGFLDCLESTVVDRDCLSATAVRVAMRHLWNDDGTPNRSGRP